VTRRLRLDLAAIAEELDATPSEWDAVLDLEVESIGG
jgi:hypothetical protein